MAQVTTESEERLARFLICGSEKGFHSVIANEDFSSEGSCIDAMLEEGNGIRIVSMVRTFAENKRFAHKEPLLYALAKVIRSVESSHESDGIREKAYKLAGELCQTATELFAFVDYDKKMNGSTKAGWGRGMRNLVKKWYESKSPEVLARETTKTKSGRGWNHKDLLRLVHACPPDESQGSRAVFRYLTHGKEALQQFEEVDDQGVKNVLSIIYGIEELNAMKEIDLETVKNLVEEKQLRERQVPTHLYRIKEPFVGMLNFMTLTDIIKRLHKLAALGLLDPSSPYADQITARLTDQEALKAEKIPSMELLLSLRRYNNKNHKQWLLNFQVTQALKDALGVALSIEPSMGKRCLIAVHVDKLLKRRVLGSPTSSIVVPSAALAQHFINTEPEVTSVYFGTGVTEMHLQPKMVLTTVIEHILQHLKSQKDEQLNLCEPLHWANRENKLFDCILILAEEKTVPSLEEFHNALTAYRSKAPNVKVAVVGLNDRSSLMGEDNVNLLDITGFNVTVPAMIRHFFLGIP